MKGLRTIIGLLLMWSGMDCLAQHPDFIEHWRDAMTMPGSNSGFGVIGDFNGDGRDEHAQIGLITRYADRRHQAVVSLSGQLDDDGWRVLQFLISPETGYANLFTLKRAGPDALALTGYDAAISNSYFPNLISIYSGIPLTLESSIAVPAGTFPLGLADVDADGVLEIIEHGVGYAPAGAYFVRARDTQSGEIDWSMPILASYATFAQLDADLPLEIVLTGSVGVVLDGFDGAVEWSVASGFGILPHIGNFDDDPATREIITLRGEQATVFQTNPFNEAFSFHAGCCDQLTTVADLDGNGKDELLVGNGDGVNVHSISDGVSHHIPHPPVYPGSLHVSEFDDEPGLDLLLAGAGSGNASITLLDPFDNGRIKAQIDTTLDPALPLLLGDFMGNGSSEIATLELGYTGAFKGYLRIRDQQDGRLLRQVSVPGPERYLGGPLYTNLAYIQLDADPALEIVFSLQGNNGNELTIVDGATLQTERAMVLRDSQSNPLAPSRIVFADTDSDGTPELLIVTREVRVYLFDPVSGELLWNSLPLGTDDYAGLVLAQADDDPALEILVTVGKRVFAFDAQTHAAQWSRFINEPGIRRIVVDSHSVPCRLAAIANDGRVQTASCADRNFVERMTFERPVTWVGWSFPDSDDMIAVDGHRLLSWNPRTQQIASLGSVVGGNAGFLEFGLELRHVAPDVTELFLASDGEVGRFTLRSRLLFVDGFE